MSRKSAYFKQHSAIVITYKSIVLKGRLSVTKEKNKTREHILDVAEGLFADLGRHGVSIRDITQKADVRLASVNYYFGSKIGLFVEVLARRVGVLSDHRLELLNAIDHEKLSADEATNKLVHAFVYPLLERSVNGGPGWKNYCRLIANTAVVRTVGTPVLSKFDETALSFVDKLKLIYPSLSDRQAHYGFQFLIGTTIYTFSENLRLDMLTQGKYKCDELEPICEELTKFLSAGLKGLVET